MYNYIICIIITITGNKGLPPKAHMGFLRASDLFSDFSFKLSCNVESVYLNWWIITEYNIKVMQDPYYRHLHLKSPNAPHKL